MKALYFDCFSGASGDMILGALVDAGASQEFVLSQVDALALDAELTFSETSKNGVRSLRARVEARGGKPRPWDDVSSLVTQAPLNDDVKARSLTILLSLFTAEAEVHGVDIEHVHLHEVGADDALIDIVGSCAALKDLAPESVFSSALPLGAGTIESAHGLLPVPAPAVLEILRGVPVVGTGSGELVTPTGAALIKAFVDRFAELPPFVLSATGYGAGSRDLELPNVVRVLVGELLQESPSKQAWIVETNIDDMTPELFPYVVERLIEAGASDAWVTPITMKKGRLAFKLTALCERSERDRILDVFYSETTTLGARLRPVLKDELDRDQVEAEFEGHTVKVKVGRRGGRVVTASPEYEDAVRAARATGAPLKDVYRAVRAGFDD
jgi:pyridinium-3,5-bisthiocarboxylic acid mononucleotide nickel chelatase